MLDGYAGTGAVGIEALSRGAAHVTFVERDRRAQALIAENLAHCGVENGYAIIRATVARASISSTPRRPAFEPFDIILLDPPYDERRPTRRSRRGGRAARARRAASCSSMRAASPAPETRGPPRADRGRWSSGDSALAFYE